METVSSVFAWTVNSNQYSTSITIGDGDITAMLTPEDEQATLLAVKIWF